MINLLGRKVLKKFALKNCLTGPMHAKYEINPSLVYANNQGAGN